MELYNKQNITLEIKQKAKKIGFDLVGVCSAKPFTRAYKILKNRKLSEFVNENKEKLTDPSKHLASAKSIIALGISYASKVNIIDNKKSKQSGKNSYKQFISLYARGIDYHQIINKKMDKLIAHLNSINPEVEVVAYSDTGSILDREAAYRAGLGWIGKNNNLINPKYGSYLFLGEIITNLELKFDKVVEAQCGNCTRCLSACPAKALNPYHLDPDKCLSYLTQKKGILTEKEREDINNRLWGCDTCLDVCPYNNDIPLNTHQEFIPVLEGNIKKILQFTKNDIPLEWKNSALSWRGLRILKRNTIINIGNKGDNEYIPLLEKSLKDPSPILRAYAVWALGKMQSDKIIIIIKKHYENEKSNIVLTEIENILNKNKRGEIND